MSDDAMDDAFREFGRLLTVEMQAVNEQMHQAIGRTVARNAARGLAISGNSMSQVATEAANTITTRSQIALILTERVFSAFGVSISDAKSRLLEWSEQFFDDYHQQLRSIVEQTAPFRGQGITKAAKTQTLGYIFTKTSIEKQRFTGEISLMAARSLPPLDEISNAILLRLRAEFTATNRQSQELRTGYAGLTLNDIEEQTLGETGASKVDFDLSLKALEERKLVDTGPKVPYENRPGSSIAIFAIVSKREHIFLTEAGYRASSAVKSPSASRSYSRPTVHISGGNFSNSPIGVGETVTQSLNFDVTNENQTVHYLSELLAKSGKTVDAEASTELTQMVQAANDGDLKAAKPLFQKLFGAAGEAIKQLAYGVLTTIVTKQMGM